MNEQALTKIEPMPATPSVEAMITLAVERGATVETLERLMAIRREVRAEQAKEAYDRALANFQAECPTIQKTAKVMNKDGRSVRYQYAPLDAIVHQVKGILQRNGFSYSVNAKAEPTQVTAVCRLTHANGHSETSEFAVPIDRDAYMNPAQQVASALTFAKRYAFCNACGIMTGDQDDDSQSSHPPETAKPPSQSQERPRTSEKLATPEQQKRWTSLLKSLGQPAVDYCVEKGWLFPAGENEPGQPIETMALKHVPTTKGQADAILAEIQARMDGQAARPPSDTGAKASDATAGNVERNSGGSEDHKQTAWYRFEMPWGKQKGTPLGELDKKYLFGLWANYEVETEYRGKPKKPEAIEADEEFRQMLDEAGHFYQF